MRRIASAGLGLVGLMGAVLATPPFATGSDRSTVNAPAPSHFPNGTVNAATCGRDDVQTAVNRARDGQIVRIPAGTCAWPGGVTVKGKGVYLKGEANLGTHIQFAAGAGTLIDITKDASHHVAVGHIDFRYLSGTGVYITVGGTGRPFLVHDNTFDANASLTHVMRIRSNGGVFWSNTITNHDTANGNPNGIVQLAVPGDTSGWTNGLTLGGNDANGRTNTYLEDNTFTRTLAQSVDCDDNGRLVFRYNRMNDAALVVHGRDTSPQGCRQWEVYNNTFRRMANTYAINRWLYVRGATGVFTDNVLDEADSPDRQTYPNKAEVDLTVQNLRRKAGPNACCRTYPCPHQVGQSTDAPDATPDEPAAFWNNTGPGARSSNYIVTSNYTADDCGGGPDVSGFIQSGRDYVTSAKSGYTKYAYPHPLRTGA
jgi:hypothetical protein